MVQGHLRFAFAALVVALILAGGVQADIFTFVAQYNGSGGFNGANVTFKDPRTIAVGGGKIYVSDQTLEGIYVLQNDTVSREVGGGGVTVGIFSRPYGMFWVSPGVLYVADQSKAGVIQYVEPSQWARIGPLATAGRTPIAVWIENDTMYMLDATSEMVMVYSISNNRNMYNELGGGVGTNELSDAHDIYMDEQRIYIADSGNNRIEVYDRNFTFLDSWGTGRGNVSLKYPTSVTGDGNAIYVADSGNDRVVMFGYDGYPMATLGDGQGNGSYGFRTPLSVRASGGHLFVLDSLNRRVMEYALNASDSGAQILARIADLNQSVQAHKANVLDVMDELNVSHDAFRGPGLLAQAAVATSEGRYSDAAAQVADAQTELNNIRPAQEQTLHVRIQQLIDADNAAMDRYRGLTLTAEQSAAQGIIINRISDAQAKLNDSRYAASAAVLRTLDGDIATWASQMDSVLSNTTAGNVSAPPAPISGDTRKAVLLGEVDALSARMQLMQAQADKLRENVSSGPINTLLDSARSLLQVGAYDEANQSIVAASGYVDRAQKDLESRQADVDAASAEIDKAQAIVNASSATWAATGVDIGPIKSKLDEARSKLYADPNTARARVAEANVLIAAGNDKASDRGFAIGGFVMGLAVVAIVLGIAYFLLKSRRKRKGLR